MCPTMKEYVNFVLEEKIENALNEGKSPDLIAEIFDIPLEKVLEIQENME